MKQFPYKLRWIATTSIFVCSSVPGCASIRDRGLPETIIRATDPALGREYLLYRPANYDRERDWPLVIACSGGLGEGPQTQIKRWRELADKYGFLVAAPLLMSGGDVAKLPDDERHVRSVLGHVQAGQSISDDRILMYGQGSGAMAALVTALGAPDLIRAAAFSDPRFRVEDLEAMNRKLDSSMLLYIRYNSRDAVLGKFVRDSVDWLRTHGANLRAETFGNADSSLQRVVEFYQNAIRNEAWLRIQATPTGAADGMELSFLLRTKNNLTELHWQFGDGGESSDPAPVHRYTTPGTYTVRVTGRKRKDSISQTLEVRVPAATLTPTQVP